MEQPYRNSVFSDAIPGDVVARGRDSLFLNARFRFDRAEPARPVRVRNLSAGGLMAELSEPLAPDCRIEIDVRGIGWVAGRVAWQTEGRAGIAFDRPIDPQRARKPVIKPDAPRRASKPFEL